MGDRDPSVLRAAADGQPDTFVTVLQALWDQRYTGAVVVVFRSGRPEKVEVPAGRPTVIVLDTRPSRGA